MNRIIIFFFVALSSFTLFSQDNTPNNVATQLTIFFQKGQFKEAQNFLKDNSSSIDIFSANLYTSLINIGLFAQGKTVDEKFTVDNIEKVLRELSASNAISSDRFTDMMPCLNNYVHFLGEINNPLYMDIYRLFRKMWPNVTKENSESYIIFLENISSRMLEGARYSDALSVLNELMELYDQGYTINSKPHINYGSIALCLQNLGELDASAIAYDKAISSISYADKISDMDAYMSLLRLRFELAVKLSHVLKCRDLAKTLIDYYKKEGNHAQDIINVSIEIAEIEFSANNTKAGILEYENGIKYILNSNNYDDENRKSFIENLYYLYDTNGVDENSRKFKDYKNKFKIGRFKKKQPVLLDEIQADSLLQIVQSDVYENDINGVKSHTSAVKQLSSYYANRKQELRSIQLLEDVIYHYNEKKISETYYAILYKELGSVYSLIQDIDNAKNNHRKSQLIYEMNGIYNSDYVETLCALADDYLRTGDLTIAKVHLDKAHKIVESQTFTTINKDLHYRVLQGFSNLYKTLDDENKALLYNKMILDDLKGESPSDYYKNYYLLHRIQLLLYFDKYREALLLSNNLDKTFLTQYDLSWIFFELKYFNEDPSFENELHSIKQISIDISGNIVVPIG